MTTTTEHANLDSVPTLTLGWRLRLALDHGDMTGVQMAEHLRKSEKTITRYCHDQSKPGYSDLLRWALLTRVDSDWLVTGHAKARDNGPDGGGDVVTYFGAFRSKRDSAHRWPSRVTPLPVAA